MQTPYVPPVLEVCPDWANQQPVTILSALPLSFVMLLPTTVRIVVLLVAIVSGVTLTFTVHRVPKPLREASSAAALITPRNLRTRLPVQGVPGEIRPLIHAFKETLGRLENGFSVQQQFLASAAHELQTPLTLIRAQMELQPEINGKELLFGEIDPPASTWADRRALFILLKNVVENAINVSSPDSAAWLIVSAVSIEVRDEGPNIREEYMPFLFKRYWRAPDARHDGAGPGLAICKEIAVAHEWRLMASSLSSSTRFTVWF